MKNELVESAIKNLIYTMPDISGSQLNSLEWRLEKSNPNSVVVYQLNEGFESLNKLKERLSKNKPGLLVLNREVDEELSVPVAIVKNNNWSECLYKLSSLFYPIKPNLKLIGVTGTNGKTTTVDLVLQLADKLGIKGVSIGTLGVRKPGETLEEFGLTTPGQIQLYQLLNKYGADVDFVVMEVSSHALVQKRIYGLQLLAGAWTSFTQDHLDYHGSMEEYFQAKKMIHQYLVSPKKLFVPKTQEALLEKLRQSIKEVYPVEIKEKSKLKLFFRTQFNQENLACAVALVEELGVKVDEGTIIGLEPPPGRFYIKEWDGRTAVVDFAHTPDALENILQAMKESFPTKKIITLFGCGGDRDRKKRPLMGAAVAKYSDKIILTSDNPRTEDPQQIIEDILPGLGSFKNYIKEVERPLAVANALKALTSSEVLLLAGKGHENYIIKGTQKIHYSDIEELDKFVSLQKDNK